MKLKSRNNDKKKIIILVVLAVILVAAIVTAIVVASAIKKNNETITGIMISQQPSDIVYFVGEEFDPTGLVIQVLAKSNDVTYFVKHTDPELKITGFDSSVANEKLVLTVTYREFSTTLNVMIKEIPPQPPTAVSIKMSDNFRTTYPISWWNNYGPIFDGVELIVVYSDGSEESVPMQSYYCYEVNKVLSKPGETSFKVVYNGFECWVTVTVTE